MNRGLVESWNRVGKCGKRQSRKGTRFQCSQIDLLDGTKRRPHRFPPEEFVMKHMSIHNADCIDLGDGNCVCSRRSRWPGESPQANGLRRRRGAARVRLRSARDCNRERLKAIELAIANYNTMIRTLKKQMQEGTANSCAFRQALAQYQQWREDLDVKLGLERAY
jgi:hypothetical protein